AQFSYESLALPLAFVGVLATLRRSRSTSRAASDGWTLVAVLTISATIMTHHLTAYLLVAFLLASCVASVVTARKSNYWDLAIFSAVATLAWVFLIAPSTTGYLGFIFGEAFAGVQEAVVGDSAARAPFEGEQTSPLAPRVVGALSTLTLVVALLVGLARRWRLAIGDPALVILFAVGALYPLALAGRLVPSVWETANRASEFLFVGVALLVALSGVHMLRTARSRWLGQAAFGGLAVLTICGAVIVGWPDNIRLAQPYRAEIGERSVEFQTVTSARWMLATYGPGHRIGGPRGSARPQLTAGRQELLVGAANGNIAGILESPPLVESEQRGLAINEIEFMLVDRRRISSDSMAANFFGLSGPSRAQSERLNPPGDILQFDAAGADRVFDAGSVAIYDLGAFR
ncbi:MAG: hypothetical protein OEM67_07060, partial [Thermoleophilia bacterium]|nr:hypothetical protein [Thermoleophilia bacterium]